MTIAVTGHTGFIGRHVVTKLEQKGHSVIGLSRSSGADINDKSTFKKVGKFDVLIHLASNTFIPDSFNEPGKFFTENLIGTVNALEACRKHKAKIIFISSYVYGHPEYLPIDEKHPINPANPYTWSKKLGEDLCRSYHENFGVAAHIIRPFNVYGPGQKGKFLIPLILGQLVSGKIKLQDERPKRDFIHVEDLANALVANVDNNNDWSVLNIGSGESIAIADLTKLLVREKIISDENITFTQEKRANEVLETKADISAALKLLDWKPQKKFTEEFLKMAIDAIANHEDVV